MDRAVGRGDNAGMVRIHDYGRVAVPRVSAAAVPLLLASLGGCTPSVRLDVTQPGRPAPLDRLELRGKWAFFDTGPDGNRLLLATAHPGAMDGQRQYYLYLLLPDRSGVARIGDPLAEGSADRCAGFFIQRSGALAGRAEFIRGDLKVSQVPLGRGIVRTGRVVLHCDDGTVIDGRFTARRRPLELRTFEQETYPPDVAALRRSARQTGQGPS